jgi:2-polyprenyl-3-methyl-5-hydroxy-6-metoxy-1,4-benzoquinol methylase
MADQTATLLEALPELAGKSVLVVGCGDGRYPRLFRGKGARRVVGVDADQVLIAVAQREEERNPIGISYEVHSLARLPVMGSFNIVTAFIRSTEQWDDTVDRLAASLGPDGVIAIATPKTSEVEEALQHNGFQDIERHTDIYSARKAV